MGIIKQPMEADNPSDPESPVTREFLLDLLAPLPESGVARDGR